MEILLLKYGYVLLFAGVALEGEAFLIAGGFLANRGYFNLVTVGLVALAANTLSAQFYYTAARVRGRPWLDNRFPETSRYRKVIEWVGRRTNSLLLISRFLFGLRIVIPVVCGAFGMPVGRFVVFNIIAGILWVIPTVLAGFYFGESVAPILQGARPYIATIILIALMLLALFLAFRHIRRIQSIFQNLAWSDLHNAIPFVMGLMGVLNIASSVWPSSEALLYNVRAWLPLEVSQGSRILMLFTGVALLQVTRNLARRKELAWYVAVIALSASLFLHFTSGLDIQNSLGAALLLIYLIYFRRRFYTRTDPASLKKGLIATPLLLFLVLLYGLIGFEATYTQFEWGQATPVIAAFRAGILILTPHVRPLTPYAAMFLTSLQIAGWMARIYILVLVLRPFILRDRLEAPREAVERIFRQYGKYAPSAFAVQPDKHHLLVADRKALVAYASKGSVAVACGDPIASDEVFDMAVTDFEHHCAQHGWVACVYLAAEERVPAYESLHMQATKVAQEAIIDLGAFSFQKSPYGMKPVQHYDRSRGKDPLIDEQLEEVTEDWLEARHLGEMSFNVGHFSLEQLSAGPVFVLGNRYYIEAFCAWLPYHQGCAAVLDLIRQRTHISAETVRMFVAQSLAMLKEMGFQEASLTTTALDQEQIQSFQPHWENRYLIHPRDANVEKIMRALKSIQKR